MGETLRLCAIAYGLLLAGCGGSGASDSDGGLSGGSGGAPSVGSMSTGAPSLAGAGGDIGGGQTAGPGGAASIEAGAAAAGASSTEGGAGSGGVITHGGAGGLGGSVGTGGSTAGAGGGASLPPATSICPEGPFAAPMVESSQAVCAGFAFNHTFNEGPTWVAIQNAFFFTNFVQGQATGGDIVKYTPSGACEIFIRDVGCNGLAATADGNLVATCHQSRSVIRFDLATKEPTTLADGYMGLPLDTPNDLVVHSNGTLYFTNPNYELAGRPQGVGRAVFRIDPFGLLSRVAETNCNGIGLSPDERKLYVLQAGVWDLDADGLPSNRTELFTSGDGIAVDCAGNVYAAGAIFSPEGQRRGSLGPGTNFAFGGAALETLLVVGPNTQVREPQMSVPGLP